MGWGKEHSPHLLPCLPRGPSPPDQWLRQHLRPLQVRGQTPQRRGLQDRSSGTPGGRGVPSWPPPAPGGTCAPWPVPPHPASDSFCGPRGSLSQGPAWGQLDLRGLHVVPPAVSSLGGGAATFAFSGAQDGEPVLGRVLPSLGAAPSAVWPLCGDHGLLSAGAPGGRRAGSASWDGGTETSCRPFWWPLRPRRPCPPGSLWPACWAPGRVSGSQVTALLWAVRQVTRPARDPGTLTSCPQVRDGRQRSPRPSGAAV